MCCGAYAQNAISAIKISHPERFEGVKDYFTFDLRYTAPFNKFLELKRLQGTAAQAAGRRSEFCGYIIMDLSSWLNHQDFKVEEVTPSKKYEITDIAHPKDPSLHRIRALQRVSETVGPGTLGGYVQSEENLSQENDDAWIYGDAVCCEKAFVSGNAFLTGQARVSGTALVAGTAEVGGQARVCDYAVVTGGTVQECALVCGHAVVRKNPSTECIPMVEGHATVMGVVAGAVYLGADAFILPGNTVDNPTNSVLAINGTHVRLYSIEQVKPPKAPER